MGKEEAVTQLLPGKPVQLLHRLAKKKSVYTGNGCARIYLSFHLPLLNGSEFRFVLWHQLTMNVFYLVDSNTITIVTDINNTITIITDINS